jgi:hypothetical protein
MPRIIAKRPDDRKGQGLSYNNFWTFTPPKTLVFFDFSASKKSKMPTNGESRVNLFD